MILALRDVRSDSSSEEGEGLEEASHTPRTVSEKRTVQNAIFDKWISSVHARDILKSSHKRDPGEPTDRGLSTTELLARQQASKIITSPREYQLELFERAKKENTIAVLGTGSGKTLIAVLLLRWVIDQELTRREEGLPPKISFFLCYSVALVSQQYAFLQANLDHQVCKLIGNDSPDSFSDLRWEQLFREYMIIVCTPAILENCLTRAQINITKINLMVFDEAHHTKKKHPYANIVRDYYIPAPGSVRPRIFGMTASPVDSKSDLRTAAIELECLLNCKIASATDTSLGQYIHKPSDQVVTYEPLRHNNGTPLLSDVGCRFEDVSSIQDVLRRASEVAHDLGQWCADNFLINAISQEKESKFQVSAQKSRLGGRDGVAQLDNDRKRIRAAIDYVQDRGKAVFDSDTAELNRMSSNARQNGIFPSDFLQGHNLLSTKVAKLHQLLTEQFEQFSDRRCIVFVKWKQTAQLLHRLFQHLANENIRCNFMVGSSSNNGLEEGTFTLRSQVVSLSGFRDGTYNCLFATSVAEEGLDVPDCDLVIRFDLYDTMIQYVQSRGRARKPDSTFVHMVERSNRVQAELVQSALDGERLLKTFIAGLDPDRLLRGGEDDEPLSAAELNQEIFEEPSTGARMTYDNALGILASFVSALPVDPDAEAEEPRHPVYAIRSDGSQFVAEVILPSYSPIKVVQGKRCRKKTLAKRAAAFRACLMLHQKAYLDNRLQPTYQKKAPVMQNALLAAGMNKSNTYPMRTKPSVWARGRGVVPVKLWSTLVDFVDGCLERPHQPIILLTREPMPSFPKFPIYLNDGQPVMVAAKATGIIASIDIEKLTIFTLCVFRDVFSKEYKEEPAMMSYWLCPAKGHTDDMQAGRYMEGQLIDSSRVKSSPIEHLVDHILLDKVAERPNGSFWTPDMATESLLNKFLVDPRDGGRKFFSECIHPHLRPTDDVPQDAVSRKNCANILEYSCKPSRKAMHNDSWNLSQPVIVAEQSGYVSRRNVLSQPNERITTSKAYLCPEPLQISSLPPSVAMTCLMWPGIIHRLEAYLIGIEGCARVGVNCSPEHALAAFTKDSNTGDQDENHENESPISVQSGMGENYERLEFLGDTFLKTATTIATFIVKPHENENEGHIRRMLMLCNKNLFDVAVSSEFELFEYVRSMPFTRRGWYPEGLTLLKGKGAKPGEERLMCPKPQTHSLSQKSLADVCEALIGASFLKCNRPGFWTHDQWDNAVLAVQRLVRSADHPMTRWNDYNERYSLQLPRYQIGEATAAQRDLAVKVQSEHAYPFTSAPLLQSAFVHPSLPFSQIQLPSYQRLELLGDSLLDLAAVVHLFYRYPDKDPQWLTEHKMAIASNRFLGALCVKLGFHKHLRHSEPTLAPRIVSFVNELERAATESGRSKDYWTLVNEPPKCLPDIVEAYIGAMFVDSKFNYSVVQDFFDRHIRFFFEDMSIYDDYARDQPVTRMTDMFYNHFGCTDFRILTREWPGGVDGQRRELVIALIIHNRIVEQTATTGTSRRYGESRVAKRAVALLEDLSQEQFRVQWGCVCRVK